MHLITTWFGTFLYENEIKEMKLFPKDKEEIAKRLFAIEKGEILEEEKEITKGKKFFVNEQRLLQIGGKYRKEKIEINAEQFGYKKEFFQQCTIELAKLKMKNAFSEDILIIQSVNAIDDYNEIINLLSERLHEWYGYYFPELVEKKENLLKFIFKEKEEILKELNLNGSVGYSLKEEDIKAIKILANSLIELQKAREKVEKYIEEKMKILCPNLTYIIGANLGAKLIALSGGLERLAKMPSSTIQILGAEKALFRFMKGQGSSPKHGIIFQHPLIHTAKLKHRGKIARSLSGKISIAVKMDFYSKEFIGEKLKKDLEKRVEGLS